MGRRVPDSLLAQVRAFDPAVDIIWNPRIGRWVVVQVRRQPDTRVSAELRGAVPGEHSHLSPIFVCEQAQPDVPWAPGNGVPIEPGPWIIAELYHLRNQMRRTPEQVDRWLREHEQKQEREFASKVGDLGDNLETELARYGKKGQDELSKRHILIEAPDGADVPGNPVGAT